MIKNKHIFIICLVSPIVLGALGSLLGGSTEEYREMIKPPLTAPSALYGPVWGTLYLMQGYSSYRIAIQNRPRFFPLSLVLYGIGLLFINLWPLLYFRLELYAAAWCLIALLILWETAVAVLFFQEDHLAGILLVPLLIWLTYAGYLNLGIWLLNP